MKSLERIIETLLYQSRWLLAPIYLGLAVLLAFLVVVFFKDLFHLAPKLWELKETDVILAALTLIDLALVASLVVMVVISGYENFVSRIDLEDGEEKLSWVGKLDSGTLKLKVSSSIVAISSIHLLKAFMNAKQTSNETLMWLILMHLTFVLSALLMAVIDRYLTKHSGAPDDGH